MTIEQAFETVRIRLGDRNEHHPRCNSVNPPDPKFSRCDCYAQLRQLPHQALDLIEQFVRETKERAEVKP